ncbi:MAG: serine hydrolase [Patescibacteria group bacterium]|jgi:D-alanyl-D-alanine endopeptidase (penicillin-binding protein 7)
MKKFVGAIVTAVILLLPQVGSASTSGPTKHVNAMDYSRSDKEFASAIVIDQKSGEVLYEYKPDTAWSAASLTKLMGALVFMDQGLSWNKIVDIRAQDEVGGGRLRVSSGATLRVVDLLYSSITASANNAAMALARISGLGQAGFVKAMNVKAKALGLENSTFVDASGMDPKNVTTARDMAKLASMAFNTEAIRKPSTTGSYTFTIRNTGQRKELTNTNDILTKPVYDPFYVTGGKTGFLYESMYNLALRVKPTGEKTAERSLMVVVFGSQTREASFKSATSLANWAWKAYKW